MKNQPLQCLPLKLDAFQRGMMPLGVGMLVLLGCVWLGFVLSMLQSDYKMQREGVLRSAEVYEEKEPYTISDRVIRFLKARYTDKAGKTITFDIPKGVEHAPGVKFEVLQYQDQFKLADYAKQQLWLGIGMASLGVLPFFVAVYAVKTTKRENQRIARLTQQNHRVPALAVRVSERSEKRAGSMSRIYRVHATFEQQGKQYEATSEGSTNDPSANMNIAQISVLLDRVDPLQSLIAPDTLP